MPAEPEAPCRQQSLPAVLVGLIEAAHPYPIAMVVSLTFLLGLVSARGHPPAGRLALAALAMLLSQLAIGWSNDYLDRETDIQLQPAKPIARGAVRAPFLPPLAGLAVTCSLLAGLLLGLAPLALLIAGTTCGLIYDLGLKDTRLSWLPYVVAFGLLPLFVWVSLDAFRTEYLGLYLIGPPLVFAVHLANSLPDIETDRAAGRLGLTARLGRGRSLPVLAACLVAPAVLTAASALWLSYDWRRLLGTFAAYSLLGALAAVAYRSRPAERAARRGFRLIAPAAVIFAAGWLASV